MGRIRSSHRIPVRLRRRSAARLKNAIAATSACTNALWTYDSERYPESRSVNCPVCTGDTRVLRTDITERRRECVRCGHRLTTVEVPKDDLERSRKIIEDAKALSESILKAA